MGSARRRRVSRASVGRRYRNLARSLLDFGSRLGRSPRKCLQNAVLGLCPEELQCSLRRRFLRDCQNSEGAGMCGTRREVCNFLRVELALRAECRCVNVVETASLASWYAGEVEGSWCIGSADRRTLGFLLWSRQERHVYVVLSAMSLQPSTRVPPSSGK